MIRGLEFLAFTGLALVLHAAAWFGAAAPGSESSGAAGAASLTLVPASAQIAALVEDWTRPVRATQMLPAAPDAPVPQAAPDMAKVGAAIPTPEITAVPEPAPRDVTPVPMLEAAPARPRILDRAPRTAPRPLARPMARAEPAPRSADPAPATAAQTARGTGSGAHAGSQPTQQSATLSDAARNAAMAQWGAAIRDRVERRKRHPAGSAANGTAVLRISVSTTGRLAALSVVQSSGDAKLDAAALRAAQAARYPAAPDALPAAQYSFNLPLVFVRR